MLGTAILLALLTPNFIRSQGEPIYGRHSVGADPVRYPMYSSERGMLEKSEVKRLVGR